MTESEKKRDYTPEEKAAFKQMVVERTQKHLETIPHMAAIGLKMETFRVERSPSGCPITKNWSAIRRPAFWPAG